MNHLWMSFQVVFPLFFYMLIGYGIRRVNLLSETVMDELNQLVFKLILPVNLFMQIYRSDLTHSLNPKLSGLVLLLLFAVYVSLYIGVPHFIKEKKDAVVILQGIYRSNFVLFGFVLANNLCQGQDTGVVAALAALVVPIYNILAVVALETMLGGKVKFGHILLGIIKNPLVIGGVSGIFFAFFRIPIPDLLVDSLAEFGDMATPIALICLGGVLSFKSVKRHRKLLTAAVLGRLVIVPVIAISAGVLLGYRYVELVALLALFASPTAISSVPMSYAMGANGKLAGEIVAITSVASIFTLFVFIYVMKLQGWIS
ncbi:MAG: AEC family transporter [Lachnospiraceae bacterium]|jgi:predicted permease